jgi:hypothetical protein
MLDGPNDIGRQLLDACTMSTVFTVHATSTAVDEKDFEPLMGKMPATGVIPTGMTLNTVDTNNNRARFGDGSIAAIPKGVAVIGLEGANAPHRDRTILIDREEFRTAHKEESPEW